MVGSSHIFSVQEISRHATWIKIQVITVPEKDSRAPAPRESRPDEEKGKAERVEESGLRQEIGGIHYPELLVILERSLRATASDALEEYKKLRRGSWVLRTMPLFSYFFFPSLHSPTSSSPRPFLPLDTCSFAMDSNPFRDSGRNLCGYRHQARFDERNSVAIFVHLKHGKNNILP